MQIGGNNPTAPLNPATAAPAANAVVNAATNAAEVAEAAITTASLKMDVVSVTRTTRFTSSKMSLGDAGMPSTSYERNQELGKDLLKGGELQKQLEALGAGKGMPPGALNEWATANPGLAYKLLKQLEAKQAAAPAPATSNEVF